MKLIFSAALLVAMLLVSCSNDDIALTPVQSPESFKGDTYGSLDVSDVDPATFKLSELTEPISETEICPSNVSDPYYEDFSQNWIADALAEDGEDIKEVLITFSENGATVSGETSKSVVVTADGGHVTVKAQKKRIYRLKGTCPDASFKVYSDKKFGVILDGVSLTNPKGSVINIQKGPTLDEKKRCYLMIATGTENTLTDGTSYTATPEGEDEKGCIFSEGKLLIDNTTNTTSGVTDKVGTLTVNAKAKNGIASDDYIYIHKYANILVNASVGDGIKANDGIIIGGGVVNISVMGVASKGLNSSAEILIKGGRTAIINQGSSEKKADGTYSYASCVKSDSIFTITDGALIMRSAAGEGSVGVRSNDKITISGGSVKGYCYDEVLKSDSAVVISDKNKVYLYSVNSNSVSPAISL